ncbi:MAG: Sec-independent protein translocase TatB [Proteobacteria bacterium]|nr:Sec-independent protein translocase TatB [Pseudomonadota bacterium]
MFDVAFSELMVIAIIALIFVGPERLPGVARTVGHLVGRARRYVNDVKSDIENELHLEDLKQLRAKFQESALSLEAEVREGMESAHAELQESMRETVPETVSEKSLADLLAENDKTPDLTPPAESGKQS